MCSYSHFLREGCHNTIYIEAKYQNIIHMVKYSENLNICDKGVFSSSFKSVPVTIEQYQCTGLATVKESESMHKQISIILTVLNQP